MVKTMTAIDIKLEDFTHSDGIAYFRLDDNMKSFLDTCSKNYDIIGFEYEKGDRNFGVIVKKKMVNTRTKGQILEKHVCEQIRLKGLDDHVRPSFNSGATNTEKADIWTSLMMNEQNVGIECKNHKTVHLIEWWEQTKKLEKLGREPVLVYKIHNAPLGDTICTMYLDSWLDILKENQMLKNKIERLEIK